MTQEEMWLLAEKWHGEKTEGFFADCERLKTGEPLAYIIGTIPFLNTIIHLDSHPLIPRSETEFWVQQVLQEMMKKNTNEITVLDLCAGSGCIGVAVLKNIEATHVDFAEIDVRHHATIQKNIEKNAIDPNRTRIFGGDLFEQITDTYEYILTNPPYIDPMLDRTEPSVTHFEPERALYGGTDGLTYITRIISEARRFLKPNGTLVIEHEPEQTEHIRAMGTSHGFFVSTKEGQYSIERYTVLTHKP